MPYLAPDKYAIYVRYLLKSILCFPKLLHNTQQSVLWLAIEKVTSADVKRSLHSQHWQASPKKTSFNSRFSKNLQVFKQRLL